MFKLKTHCIIDRQTYININCNYDEFVPNTILSNGVNVNSIKGILYSGNNPCKTLNVHINPVTMRLGHCFSRF